MCCNSQSNDFGGRVPAHSSEFLRMEDVVLWAVLGTCTALDATLLWLSGSSNCKQVPAQ
jgi:hypothetical protein